jgi:hypothetical protein
MIVILVHSLRHVLFLQTLFTCTCTQSSCDWNYGITQRIKSEFIFCALIYFRLRLSYFIRKTS